MMFFFVIGTEYFDFGESGDFISRRPISQLFRRGQRQSVPTMIDAAVMIQGSNNPVYLFRGRQYWRLNDENNKLH